MSDQVALKLAADFKSISVSTGPEQAVKDAAAQTIAVTLQGFTPPFPVKVLAGGTQTVIHGRDVQEHVVNSCKIDIEPLIGFISAPK
jgi:hypothetical protein